MSPDMLDQFKTLVCEHDERLLKVELRKEKLYGYLREVKDDFFVMRAVRKTESGMIEELNRRTRDLILIVDYDEITPEMLPSPFRIRTA